MRTIVNSSLATVYAAQLEMGDGLAVDVQGRLLANVNTLGQGSTLAGKAQDAATAGGDVGIAAMTVRRDSLTGVSSATGDWQRLATDAGERVITSHFAPPQATISGRNASAIINTTSTQIIAADASFRRYITDVLITNESATATRVDILDGATVLASCYVGGNNYFEHSFTIPLRGTVNTAVNAQCATTAASVFVTLTGFNAPY